MKLLDKLRCVHEWEVRTTIVCRPKSVESLSGCGTDLAREIFFGKTKVIMTCGHCGRVTVCETFGEPK